MNLRLPLSTLSPAVEETVIREINIDKECLPTAEWLCNSLDILWLVLLLLPLVGGCALIYWMAFGYSLPPCPPPQPSTVEENLPYSDSSDDSSSDDDDDDERERILAGTQRYQGSWLV